jgi:hypothetical protein
MVETMVETIIDPFDNPVKGARTAWNLTPCALTFLEAPLWQ